MIDIAGLIERLEKLQEPNGEVNGLIALELGWTYQKMKGDAKPYFRKPGVTAYYQRSDVPNFTGSIDDAMTLVPDGYAIDDFMIWRGDCSRVMILQTFRRAFGKNHEVQWVHSSNDKNWNAKHTSAPIALCIAALKARRALLTATEPERK